MQGEPEKIDVLGDNRYGTNIRIRADAPKGTKSHELVHNAGVEDNDYKSGGGLNNPPERILPTELDNVWDLIPYRE